MRYPAILAFIWIVILQATPAIADKSWDKASITTIQSNLNDLGYKAGPVDGLWGAKTAAALDLFCQEYGKSCTGGEETTIRQIADELDDSYLDVIIDHSSAVWLENRIGYGAPKSRVDRYVGLTRRAAIELIVEELRTYEDPYKLPNWFENMKPLGKIIENTDDATCSLGHMKGSLQSAWLEALYTSEVPQFDRLSTFWLDHFSVGYDAYIHPHAFARHTEFVRNWRGSFLDLLYASLSDPAVIVYLNNDKSDRNTPNENLAREFFELFALGEGTYSETDVREFARLLTGRAFNTAEEEYEFMQERAIQPRVRLFGKTHSSAKSLVYNLPSHSSYGDYIITKLYQEFVSLDEPSPQNLRRLKADFLRSDSDLIGLFEAIISSHAFWDLDGQLTLIKSPLDLYAGTSRTLNSTGGFPNDYLYWPTLTEELSQFDQSIFDPLSIDGWPSGREWIQGQDLDRRAVSLSTFFSNQWNESYFVNPVGASAARRHWRNMNYNREREKALETFFGSSQEGQVLIESMHVFAYEFDPNRYSQIILTYSNVHYNDNVFDQITITLNETSESDSDWRRHFQIWKETVSNDLLRGLKMESNGDNVWYAAKLPISGSDGQIKAMSVTQKTIVQRLVMASSALLNDPRFENKIDNGWRKWLTSLFADSGGIVDTAATGSKVRLFQPPEHPDGRFNPSLSNRCDNGMELEQFLLDAFFRHEKIKAISGNQTVIANAINEDDFGNPSLQAFANNLGKLWLDVEVLPVEDRPAYLLPQVPMQNWRDILTSVEYNLR